MIVTCTPNPSIDRTLEIPSLEHGQVVRADRAIVDAGGKGVNVARALQNNGLGVRAVLPVGGGDGAQLERILQNLGLDFVAVRIAGSIRANVSLVEPDGTVTKVNAPGPRLSPGDLSELQLAVRTAAAGASWVAACGSLPPGAPDDFYASLIDVTRPTGAKIAVDSSGPALSAALRAKPDLIKPNAEELAELTGLPMQTLGDAQDAAQVVLDQGVGAVLVSLGADGALLVGDGLALHAWTDPVTPVSNVGAGDATLAGYLSAGVTGEKALRRGVAFGTAAVQLPGSAMPEPKHIHEDLVHITEIERTRTLREGEMQ